MGFKTVTLCSVAYKSESEKITCRVLNDKVKKTELGFSGAIAGGRQDVTSPTLIHSGLIGINFSLMHCRVWDNNC